MTELFSHFYDGYAMLSAYSIELNAYSQSRKLSKIGYLLVYSMNRNLKKIL